MATLAMWSLLGAVLEAGFLVLVTAVAMALVGGNSVIGPVLGQEWSLPVALVVAALTLVIRLVSNLFVVRISAALTARVTADQRNALADAYLGTSWAVQQSEPSGRLQELLTSFVSRVNNSIATLSNAVTAALSLLAFLIAAILVDPWSTLAVLAALAVVGSILTPFRRLIRRRAAESSQRSLQFANAVSELGSLGLEMQIFGVRERFTDRVDELTQATTAAQRRVQVLQGSLAPVYLSLAYAAVLAGIAIFSIVGGGDLAVVGAVILLMLRSLAYGQQLAAAAGTLAANTPFLERVSRAKADYKRTPAPNGRATPQRATPVELENVFFEYTEGRAALSNISFAVAPGEVIGVIGPSGAGKSTLAQLLLGLRFPDRGSVTAGDVDLHTVDRDWWTHRATFVAQEPRLFTGTVAENIRFFREGIDDHAIRRAAQRANILADIEALPDGFETHLGERGSQLSGGQRQRLSIARALAGDPEILILDEPTSALDGKSEALIRQTLAELKGDVTVVLIAHRMSTLDICDRIMVIEHGRVTGLAAPAELRQTNAFYREALAIARSE